MIEAIKSNRDIAIYMAILFFVGVVAKPLAYVVSVVYFISLKQRNWQGLLIISLWFILIMSDSAKGYNYAKTIKPAILLLTTFFVWFDKNSFSFKSNWTQFLIPFFIIISLFWMRHPEPIKSFEKTVSLILLFTTVPSLLMNAYLNEGKKMLYNLIWFGWFLLALTFVLSFLSPGHFYFAGRYSSLFRNPNGLGVFTVLFYFLFRTVKDVFPDMFKKWDVWFVTGVVLVSIIYCGSRGALLAFIIFTAFNQFYKLSPIIGFIITILVLTLTSYIFEQLPFIVMSLGLEAYFRLETLEDGSGRVVAWNFILEHIRESPYLGHGIGYTDYLFQINREELNLLGHQGNAHNSYLTYWLDAGVFGLISLIGGLLFVAIKSSFSSRVALPIFYAVLFMLYVESWLIASLNPFTIILVMILTLLWHKKEILEHEEKEAAVALQ